MSSFAAGALLLIGCKEDEETATTPPRVAEPVNGATVGCCLVRVRMNPPAEGVDLDGKVRPLEAGGPHANWRVNDGPIHDVQFPSTQREMGGLPYVFAAELAPGMNKLEVARCDEFDLCGWTTISLTATIAVGSPDPAFARTGQLVIGASAPRALHVDGSRTLLAVESGTGAEPTQVRSFGADGVLDTTFGTAGVAKVGLRAVRGVFPASDGKIFVWMDGYVARLTAMGANDTSFGTAGVLQFPSPSGSVFLHAMTELANGNLIVAGSIADAGSVVPGVIVLSPDGVIVDSQTLAPPGSNVAVRSAVVTRAGDVAFLTTDSVYRATIAGPVTTFGTSGVLMLPPGLPATQDAGRITFSGDRVVVAHLMGPDGRVLTITPAGQISTVMVPFGAESNAGHVTALSATADTIYVAATSNHPANPQKSWLDNPIDGSDLAVARIRAGALDGSFGTAGIARVSFMNAWRPVAVETLLETPVALAIGPDGAPVVLAESRGAGIDLWNPQFNLGPGATLVRLRP